MTTNPLRTLLASVDVPDAALAQRFIRAREVVRTADEVPDDLRIPALLAIGDHGAALDRLRALRPLSGPQSELLIHYASWTGDQRWLAQLGADGLRDIAGTSPPSRGAVKALARWQAAEDELTPVLAAELVIGAIVSLWGLIPNAASQSLAIEPTLTADWPRMALTNLRVGETLLDLVLRRTRTGMTLGVTRTRGPAIRVALTMEGVSEFDVDGEILSGGRAVFRVESESLVTIFQ